MRYFKKSIALLFLLSFVAQAFSSTLVLANYYTNKAPFIKNCINKNKPQLKCNGKCQMMKKMAEEEQKEKDNLEKKSGLKVTTLSTKSFFSNQLNVTSTFFKQEFSTEITVAVVSRSKAIFHPPC